ncbi:unnamed protein product, partial [Rotaria magnacalcarata]
SSNELEERRSSYSPTKSLLSSTETTTTTTEKIYEDHKFK